MSASMVGGLAGGCNRHSSGGNANFCRRTKFWSTIPGRSAACARIARWRSIETRSSGPRRARRGWRPLVGSPKRERRGFAMTLRGKHSPGSPSSCACNTPRRPNPTSRTRCYCFWSIPLSLERGPSARLDSVPRDSVPGNSGAATRGSGVRTTGRFARRRPPPIR